MKKLLVLMMVLGIASAANATILISVDGLTEQPESTVTVLPSETAVIDIWGDGQTPMGAFFLGVAGPASLTGGEVIYAGSASGMIQMFPPDDEGLAEYLGVNPGIYMIELIDTPLPPAVPLELSGTLVDYIEFHCEGPEDAVIMLFDADSLEVLDTQVIHQPEPMTIALLGLGGLFLRRRK